MIIVHFNMNMRVKKQNPKLRGDYIFIYCDYRL